MSKEEQLLLASKVEIYSNNTFRIMRSETEPYTLFNLIDISTILRIKNVYENNLLPTDKQLVLTETNGGKQKMLYVTYIGLLKTLTRSRRREAADFANAIGINVHQIKFSCLEASTIDCICKTFKGEECIEQFIVGRYRIDLYFPKYRLAIECDEKMHSKHIENDIVRENFISEELGCAFIRYSPQSIDFNIFEVLNQIFKYIQK